MGLFETVLSISVVTNLRSDEYLVKFLRPGGGGIRKLQRTAGPGLQGTDIRPGWIGQGRRTLQLVRVLYIGPDGK